MIKVIALDLGGVVFSDGKQGVLDRLVASHGYDSTIVKKLLSCPESTNLRRGRFTDEQFWNRAKKILPAKYDAQVIKQAYYDAYEPDPDVFPLVQQLHATGNMLMAFSGNIRSRIEYLDRKYQFRQYFGKEVYSFDYDANKPEQKLWEAMLCAAGVPGDEIFYVDDNDYYAPLAQRDGVHMHVYKKGGIRELKDAIRNAGVTF
ncbi:TPA: HAD hydrolase-like protein [Candidatus Woesearchaeota archaeon]|nr:HAD hydrolase-like protein [Candidatus Woesearchaeota archaeon]